MTTVYLNGEYLPKDEARISPDDRGFLLGDGLYEVTPFYEGVPFGLDRHLERLLRGLCYLRIDHDIAGLEAMHRELIERNGLQDAPRSMVYMQITRGAAPRPVYGSRPPWTRGRLPKASTSERGEEYSQAGEGSSERVTSPVATRSSHGLQRSKRDR